MNFNYLIFLLIKIYFISTSKTFRSILKATMSILTISILNFGNADLILCAIYILCFNFILKFLPTFKK